MAAFTNAVAGPRETPSVLTSTVSRRWDTAPSSRVWEGGSTFTDSNLDLRRLSDAVATLSDELSVERAGRLRLEQQVQQELEGKARDDSLQASFDSLK